MPTLKNMTYAPVVIELRGGKSITVEYGGTATVSDAQRRSAAVKKLIEEGKLQVVRGGGKRQES